ncbi:MAG: ABC transporter ATP-binding protein, partial [Gaiellaceae bacterium]
MPEIHVENLVKEFGDQRALDDVSFEVKEGELFTLLGPSGCGKSTTLMSIAGFQHPEAGRIAVGDDTFVDVSRKLVVPAERRNLGIVFQSYAVWPHMTVFENLAFPLKVRKLKRDAIRTRVREVLELVEMLPYEQRYPHQLSGGQQQRVALARALVYSPSVLLLDEPFSNLDAKLRERARAWVKELQGTLGLTTIFVTHDQDEALSMSDR